MSTGASPLPRKRWKHKVLASLFIIWLFVPIIPFFVFSGRLGLTHGVILNARAQALFLEQFHQMAWPRLVTATLRAGAESLLIMLAFAGWGMVIVRLMEGNRPEETLPSLLSASMLAEGMMILVLSTWMQFRALRPEVVWIALAPGLPALLHALRGRQWTPYPDLASLWGWEKALLALIVLLLLISIAYTSAILSYDASLLYSVQSRWMAEQGEIVLLSSSDGFSVSHLYAGVLYAAIIQIAGNQAARFITWWHGLATLLLLLALAREAGLSARARLIASAILLTSTAIVDLFGDGKHDLLITAFLLAALYRIVERREASPRVGRHLLNGLLIGLSIVSRPYNLFLLPAFFAFLYALFLRRKMIPLTTALTTLGWMASAAMVAGIHVLLWNHALLGDALAPLHFAQTLNASTWKIPSQQPPLPLYRAFYPFLVTFGNAPQSGGHISPLVLGFAPLLAIREMREGIRRSPLLRVLSIAAASTLALWVALSFAIAEIRYVFFLWYLLILPIAIAIEKATKAEGFLVRPWARTLPPLLLLVMIVRIGMISVIAHTPISEDGQARCNYLPYCQAINFLNENVPNGERILLYSPYRYYLRADLFRCASYRPDYIAVEAKGRLDDSLFWKEAYRRGFRYVLIDAFTMFYESRGYLVNGTAAPTWLYVEKVLEIPRQQLAIYALRAEQPPFEPVISCRPTKDGWQIIDLQSPQESAR